MCCLHIPVQPRSACSRAEAIVLRVLTLASLFPDATRPTLGPFVERQTLELAAHPDVELQVVSPRGLPPWPLSLHPRYRAISGLPTVETWKGLTVHRPSFVHLPGTGGRFDAGAMSRALLPLLETIRQTFAFDVIDAEFFFPDGPAALSLSRALNIPYSVKARGGDIHFWGAQKETAAQVLAAGQGAGGMLAVSAAIKADMVALGMPEDRIRVHYTGVDLSLFQPLDRNFAKAELGIAGPLVVTVAALISRKRQALVIDAVAKIPGATLALIGKGEDAAKLQAQAQALGIGDRVLQLGAVPHSTIARWLGAADVMCLTSASEGLANAWVEALACGTPIVISNVGGAEELVDSADAGRLVEPDSLAIANAIQSLLAKPPAQLSVRKTAERFTWLTNRNALFDHLTRVANRA
jgi:teichuronic acid biosynthesis glycosyltransferase TuaC